MSNQVYKKIEVTGSSPDGVEQAIKNAIASVTASTTQLRWFEVLETRGHIEDGQVAHWQVTVKVGVALSAG
jgi:hypothetical protein